MPLSLESAEVEAADERASSSLSMSFSSAVASVDFSVNNSNVATGNSSSVFASSDTSGTKVRFNVTTNNYTGYTLSVTKSGSTGDLVGATRNNETGTYNTLKSIGELTTGCISEANFNDNFIGYWGWKPSKLNSQSNTGYCVAPSADGVVIDKTAAANSTANSYTIGLGVRADYSVPTDVYSSTFNIVATANIVTYSITYNSNTTETVTGLPSRQTGNVLDGSSYVRLSSQTPVRTGYIFEGWNTAANGLGTSYASGAQLPISQTTSNIVTLYAQWGQDMNMQTYTKARCEAEASSAPVTLTDTRDNQTYTARFINGYCWMTQNLRLAGG
ncbi:MAG: InlB B-repeat-containing protein, partial [Candidatus Saccharibacteria bacterium]|nr:InlB B-repeat-containing protein [Candidatus Saccharibacteria bacterium]